MTARPRGRTGLRRTVLLLAVTAGALLAVTGLGRPEEAATDATGSGAGSSPGTTPSSPGTSAPVPGVSDPDALALLRRAARTSRSRSWTGSQVVSTAGSSAMTAQVEVRHRALLGSTLRVAATVGAGGAGGAVQTVYEADDDDLGSSPLAAPFAADDGAQWETLVASSYAVRRSGTDTVAGEPTDTVTLTRPDGSTAARLDVGRVSGLPLQRTLFDPEGRLVRQSVFTKVALVDPGAVADVAATAAATPDTDGSPVGVAETPVDEAGKARLVAGGFVLPAEVGGGLSLVDVQATGSDGVHLTYSDGLLAVSLFEEHGRLDPDTLGAGWTTAERGGASVLVREGGTRVSWADGGTVYTLVGDVGDDAVDRVVRGLPHRVPTGGLGHRFRRGLDRIGSWADPRH